MKIVLVNDQLNAGGAERVLVNIANLLHDHDVDVRVLLYLKPSALDHQLNKEIPVVYLNRRSRFDPKAMRLLKRQVEDADIVHIHSRYNLRYFVVARLVFGAQRHKIVYHEHVPEYNSLDRLTAYAIKKADAYVGVQERLCHWVKQNKLLEADKVYCLPNIVASPAAVNNSSFKSKRIVMVANFRKIKHHLFALDVIQALGPEYSLDFFGMVDEEDYYREVLATIEANGLKDRVTIKQGVTDLYQVLPNYHFAIHTAQNETGPLVLLEYMHTGLPFFAYNTGEVVEKVQQTIPGAVLQTFDAAEWVARIKKVLGKDGMREQLQQKMKRVIEENYSEEKYWQKLHHIYTQTLLN